MIKPSKIFFFASVIFILGCEQSKYYSAGETVKIEVKEDVEPLAVITPDSVKTVNVAISTMISPKRTFFLYENLLKYIEKKLGVKIQLKQRKTYKEVNDMMQDGRLDFAYVCSGAYVVGKREFPLGILAAPKINNRTYYQAYIIVNKNSAINNFSELKGKSFAFSDPLSNTGYKYALKLLTEMGYSPENYFSKTIFTYAHDYSIQMVARNLVSGATVDGLVYDYLLDKEPERLKNVKVIHKSPFYGIPPFVYAPNADKQLIANVQKVLINMDKDPEGREILHDLHIEAFEIVKPEIYNSLESFN
jgi:phosphonate transport system substrate-binding protein